MVFYTKMLHKWNEKTIDVYLNLIDSLVKPIILYVCECWGYSLKKDCFANKIENFFVSIYKQILGVKKNGGETCCSLLVSFCSLLVSFCSLLVTFCSFLVTFYSLLHKKFWRIFFWVKVNKKFSILSCK